MIGAGSEEAFLPHLLYLGFLIPVTTGAGVEDATGGGGTALGTGGFT